MFGPLEIILSESSEFWFDITEIWVECCFSAVCGFVILIVLMFLASLLGERVHLILISLIAGIGFALYIQGHFINVDYGVLDGRTIDWSSYESVAVWNSLIWICCISIPVVLCLLKSKHIKGGITIASICLIAIQFIAVVAMFVTANGLGNNAAKKYLSTEKIDEVSKDGNVVVFILDTFDADYFEEIYQTDREFLDPLDGFVWFDNATCMYPTTKGSLPYILTKKIYHNEIPYQEYVEEAYETTDYYYELRKHNYTIGLYTSSEFVYDKNDPPQFCNYVISKPVASSKIGLCGSLYKLTAFRYFPHIMKQFFWIYSGEFDNWKAAANGASGLAYSSNNLRYYDFIQNNRLHLSDSGKSYKVIHLNGTHLPYTITENMEETTDGSATYMTEAKASLKIVYEYIEQLNELNVYDDTLLIITADHGAVKGEPTSPILLVKLPHAKGFTRNNSPVGHADLQGTIMTALGINENSKYGKSVFEYKPGEDRTREYYYYTWDNKSNELDRLPPMVEYRIDPDSNDLQSFHLMDYTAEEYNIGDQVSFFDEGAAYSYVVYGVGSGKGTYPWTNGKQLLLAFKLDKVFQKNLLFHLGIHGILHGKQQVSASVNGDILLSKVLEKKDSSLEFVIPAQDLTGDVLEICIDFPDAISPADLGINRDIRILALSLSDMCIEETHYSPIQFENRFYVYTPGTELSFSSENNTGRKYIINGFSQAGGNGTWMTGSESTMKMMVDTKAGKDLELAMDYAVFGNKQKTIIIINGQIVDEYIATEKETKNILIPGNLIDENGIILLTIEHPDAYSPKSVGKNEDTRELSLCIKKICISEMQDNESEVKTEINMSK